LSGCRQAVGADAPTHVASGGIRVVPLWHRSSP
jgi:hypothetical protein